MQTLIELTTTEGQIVLDLFCGSGSTLVAAQSKARRYWGIEKDAAYCKIARTRLQYEPLFEQPLAAGDYR